MIKIAAFLDSNIRKTIIEQLKLIRENIEKSTLLTEIKNAKNTKDKLERIEKFKEKNYKGAEYWLEAIEDGTLKKKLSSLDQMYDTLFKQMSKLLISYPRYVSSAETNEIRKLKEIAETLKKS